MSIVFRPTTDENQLAPTLSRRDVKVLISGDFGEAEHGPARTGPPVLAPASAHSDPEAPSSGHRSPRRPRMVHLDYISERKREMQTTLKSLKGIPGEQDRFEALGEITHCRGSGHDPGCGRTGFAGANANWLDRPHSPELRSSFVHGEDHLHLATGGAVNDAALAVTQLT